MGVLLLLNRRLATSTTTPLALLARWTSYRVNVRLFSSMSNTAPTQTPTQTPTHKQQAPRTTPQRTPNQRTPNQRNAYRSPNKPKQDSSCYLRRSPSQPERDGYFAAGVLPLQTINGSVCVLMAEEISKAAHTGPASTETLLTFLGGKRDRVAGSNKKDNKWAESDAEKTAWRELHEETGEWSV